MPEVHAIKNADRENDRTFDAGEVFDRRQDVHVESVSAVPGLDDANAFMRRACGTRSEAKGRAAR